MYCYNDCFVTVAAFISKGLNLVFSFEGASFVDISPSKIKHAKIKYPMNIESSWASDCILLVPNCIYYLVTPCMKSSVLCSFVPNYNKKICIL